MGDEHDLEMIAAALRQDARDSRVHGQAGELGADLEELAARSLENPLRGRGNRGGTGCIGRWLSARRGAGGIVLRRNRRDTE